MFKTLIGAMALALTLLSAPATAATNISLSNQGGGVTAGWFTQQVGNGGTYWHADGPPNWTGHNVIVPLTFDYQFTFTVVEAALVKLNLWQSETGFTFTNISLNGISLATNLTGMIGGNPGTLVGSDYVSAGQSVLRFEGVNVANPHSFGGNINITAGTRPLPPVTAPVPEPATWAMMVLGLGVAGMAMRRSKQQVSFV